MRAPYGVGGLVRVTPYTERASDLVAYGPLHAGPGGPVVALAIVREDAAALIARIDGVTDRTAAEEWRGTLLCVPREALPATAAETFYHHDLVGLGAVTTAGVSLGRVAAVHDHGGPVLEVAGHGRTHFVAFSRDFVLEVDLEARRVVIDPAAIEDMA